MKSAGGASGEPLGSLNSACPYFTMFPLSFPLRALNGAPAGSRVLDPFCGRGTTLYAARMLGLEATGIDINPVAVAIADAKLASASAEGVVRLAKRLLKQHRESADLPDDEFWSWAYHEETLRDVCALREGLMQTPNTGAAKLLRAIALGALHGPRGKVARSYFSNQMPRTYATKPGPAVKFWQAKSLRPEPVSVLDVLTVRAKRYLANVPVQRGGKVLRGDARSVLNRMRARFTHVVCSPPYVGMRTYLPDQWLRWWFIGGPRRVDYKLEGQIATADPDRLVEELAKTWDAVARVCEPGARISVRFGALPSIRVEPSDLVNLSFGRSIATWNILEERPAGKPNRARRQAEQFGNPKSHSEDEIDVLARLA